MHHFGRICTIVFYITVDSVQYVEHDACASCKEIIGEMFFTGMLDMNFHGSVTPVDLNTCINL